MKNIVIAGNIGKDASTRQAGNSNVTSWPVAVDDRKGQEKGTLWFDVSMWGARGEALAQYLTKGTKVVVSGELSTREHEGKTYMQVRADNVTLQGGGSSGGTSDDRSSSTGGGYGGGTGGGYSDIDQDEVPF